MKLSHLQENLRYALRKRIGERRLTGLKLAKLTGFKQAHISNFLNGKRQLSIDGFDKVMAVAGLSVLDLLDPEEVNKRASIVPPAETGFENVLMVSAKVAASEPVITEEMVEDILKFKKAFLSRLRPAIIGGVRQNWHRFVLIKIAEKEARAMYPRLLGGATVLIDRHYNALTPYRRGEANMYAVRRSDGCTVKYVEHVGSSLVLRPHNQEYPVDVLSVGPGHRYSESIVGRVCHVASEV
jgi:transcriptional regulator with XRE-family HTH domain